MVPAMPARAPAAAEPAPTRRAAIGVIVAGVLLLAGGLFAYWGTWHNCFLFDDYPAIDENLALLSGDWWTAAFGPRHQPLANRPLTCLTLVVDLRVFGEGPFGPHLTNLLLHLGNAVLLLTTLRRALRAPNLGGRVDERHAHWLATAAAAIWVVHPLGVDAVAYATQRSTLLFSGCLLLAIYATLRANDTTTTRRWRGLAVVAMALGMASKEDMVTAPLLLVLFERALLLPSWVALRTRMGYYAALAATWSVLGCCVAMGPHNSTVGYATKGDISAWHWLMTQAEVVLHYLRLVLWPQPLRGAYDGGIVRDIGDALLPGLGVLALIAIVLLLWRRRPWWAWLGTLFFLLLAPTSSVMPIDTEIVAERRMYLPMLCVLVPVVVTVDRVLRGVAATYRILLRVLLSAGLVGLLALVTRERVAVYADETAFWGDAYAKMQPGRRTFLAAQILSNQGSMLWQRGRLDEAHAFFEQAMQCERPTTVERMAYAVSLQYRGRQIEALTLLRELTLQAPENGDVLGSLGTCLVAAHFGDHGTAADPRLAEAEAVLRKSLTLKPRKAAYWNSLAYVHKVRGRLPEAEDAYRHATELTTDHVEPFFFRAELLERLGRTAEIGPMFDRLAAARPQDAPLRLRFAEIELRDRSWAAAARWLQEVLRIEPGNGQATAMLEQVRAAQGR
jgi:tetratricopeptide (TPR) repeat protein